MPQSIWMRQLESSPDKLSEPSLFTTTKELAGRPDGAALDQRGFYWIAGVDGSELYVFGVDGNLHNSISLPFSAPTKVSFAGPTGRKIAVTSKFDTDDGGYVAIANIPTELAPGIGQPFWRLGA